MMDARHALVEVLERLERPLLPLLENRPHRLLAETRQQLEHVEPRRDRLRSVEEVDELLFLLLHDLLDDERQLLLRCGRQLLISDSPFHVQDLRAHLDFLTDVHALPDRQVRAIAGHELEQLELVHAERVRERLPVELGLVGMALR